MSLSAFQRRRRELAAKEAAEREAAEKEAAVKSIDDMTVPELKEYAATNEIDLGEATKKADILAAIKSAQNGPVSKEADADIDITADSGSSDGLDEDDPAIDDGEGGGDDGSQSD